MSVIRLVAIIFGLGLGLGGCVFHPDMGDRPQCERDADCADYGDCACVGGKCVPAERGSTCNYDQPCDPPCDDPPDPHCEVDPNGQDVLVVHTSVGTCEDGECSYGFSEQICPNGCLGGACVENCEMACDPGEDCIDGACRCGGIGPDCTDLELCCGTACVDPTSDLYNCGGCGNDCTVAPDPVCADADNLTTFGQGSCGDQGCEFVETTVGCPAGCVDGSCADDPCQGSCADNETCVAGDCVCNVDGRVCRGDEVCGISGCECGQGPACDTFEDCVVDTCTCPAAALACSEDEFCSPAGCVCALEGQPCTLPEICCGGVCVNRYNSVEHCGQCGHACTPGTSTDCDLYGNFVTTSVLGTCSGGTCDEVDDIDPCNYGCDPATGCLLEGCTDRPCTPEEFCEQGQCQCGFVGNVCDGDTECCAGQCVETGWNSQHCGACGSYCGVGLPHVQQADCVAGDCLIVCEDGFADCDGDPSTGCEADLFMDVLNCGDCDNNCWDSVANAWPTCVDKWCGYEQCMPPFKDCDFDPTNGCEVNPDVDESNCGYCGHPCADELVCYGGQCEWPVDGEVLCGYAGQSCASPEACCVDADGTSYCADAANGDVCGFATLYCDGPEDCPNTGPCCLDPDSNIASCSADMTCQGQVTLCHNADDCGGFNNVCHDQDLFGVLVGVCIGT